MMIDYKKILKDFNNFMEVTHIRKYCSEVCKGNCCYGGGASCYAKLTKNFNWCHQHLSCTSFICYEIENIIMYDNNIRHCVRHELHILMMEIKNNLRKLFEDENEFKSFYFTPYSLINMEFQNQFPKFKPNEIEYIKNRMDELIKNKRQL